MDKFWERVMKCEHKNLNPNYYEYVSCWTPYCGGSEVHCLDCGVYISKCGCGSNNGMSGWPQKRHRTEEIKKIKSLGQNN